MNTRIAVVVSRYNEEIAEGLLEGARAALDGAGVSGAAVSVLRVPGAFELPAAAMRAATSGRFDAVVCLGCLIKGDTMHFEYIAEVTAHGIMDVSLTTGVPVTFGVLTTLTDEQAIARSRPGLDNKGREAALAALEMVTLFRSLPGGRGEGGTGS